MVVSEERWLEVPGFESYEISDHGNVRKKSSGALMNQHATEQGYQMVFLRRNGQTKGKGVHRLMLEAFVGPCPEGNEACHINGISFDNKLCNLRWASRVENWNDKRKHGTACVGPKHGLAKLSYGCVERIRDMRRCGVSAAKIGRYFSISDTHVLRLMKQRNWGGMSWL